MLKSFDLTEKQARKVYLSHKTANVVGWGIGGIIPMLILLLKTIIKFGAFGWAWESFMLLLIAGGLIYSAPTVQKIVESMMSGSLKTEKSWGFTVLIEGALVAMPMQFACSDAVLTVLTIAQSIVMLTGLVVLSGINGYVMASYATQNLVKQTRTVAKKTKK